MEREGRPAQAPQDTKNDVATNSLGFLFAPYVSRPGTRSPGVGNANRHKQKKKNSRKKTLISAAKGMGKGSLTRQKPL